MNFKEINDCTNLKLALDANCDVSERFNTSSEGVVISSKIEDIVHYAEEYKKYSATKSKQENHNTINKHCSKNVRAGYHKQILNLLELDTRSKICDRWEKFVDLRSSDSIPDDFSVEHPRKRSNVFVKNSEDVHGCIADDLSVENSHKAANVSALRHPEDVADNLPLIKDKTSEQSSTPTTSNDSTCKSKAITFHCNCATDPEYLANNCRQTIKGVHEHLMKSGAHGTPTTSLSTNPLQAGSLRKKPHECDICHKCFSGWKGLALHMNTHSVKKPYKCECCAKGFSQMQSLRIHTCTPTGEKYPCFICDKYFSSTNLKSHISTHAKLKLHKCPVCKQIFPLGTSLKEHMLRIHKICHQCDVCGKCFARLTYFKMHVDGHKKDTPNQLKRRGNCSRNYSNLVSPNDSEHRIRSSKVNRKSERVTGRNRDDRNEKQLHQCALCKKEFSKRDHFKSHVLNHAYEEGRELGRENIYSDNTKKGYEGRLSCKERFLNKESSHRRALLKQKGLRCDVCDQRFSLVSQYKIHVKKHQQSMTLISSEDVRQYLQSLKTMY